MKENEKKILTEEEEFRLMKFIKVLAKIDRREKITEFSKQQHSDPPNPRNPPKRIDQV